MTSKFDSKHGIVSRPPFDLYMAFTDMRNFQAMLPEDKREGVTADFDTLQASRRHFGHTLPNHQLQTVAAACGYDLRRHHHALADAEACARIALQLL